MLREKLFRSHALSVVPAYSCLLLALTLFTSVVCTIKRRDRERDGVHWKMLIPKTWNHMSGCHGTRRPEIQHKMRKRNIWFVETVLSFLSAVKLEWIFFKLLLSPILLSCPTLHSFRALNPFSFNLHQVVVKYFYFWWLKQLHTKAQGWHQTESLWAETVTSAWSFAAGGGEEGGILGSRLPLL